MAQRRESGANPSGRVHSLALVLIVRVFAPLAVDVPLAALAAILFVVAVNIEVILATLHFLRRMASSSEVHLSTHDEIRTVRPVAGTHTDLRILIIPLRWAPFIDVDQIHA